MPRRRKKSPRSAQAEEPTLETSLLPDGLLLPMPQRRGRPTLRAWVTGTAALIGALLLVDWSQPLLRFRVPFMLAMVLGAFWGPYFAAGWQSSVNEHRRWRVELRKFTEKHPVLRRTRPWPSPTELLILKIGLYALAGMAALPMMVVGAMWMNVTRDRLAVTIGATLVTGSLLLLGSFGVGLWLSPNPPTV